MEDVHLLAHPDWANDLILLDWLIRQSSLSLLAVNMYLCTSVLKLTSSE